LEFFRETNSDPPPLDPFIIARDSAGKAGWASNRTVVAAKHGKPQQRANDGLALSETPSTKPQAPEKCQISNTKRQNTWGAKRRAVLFLSFELGASLELGVWNLELVPPSLAIGEILLATESQLPYLAGQ
jgi:hypothetical protein